MWRFGASRALILVASTHLLACGFPPPADVPGPAQDAEPGCRVDDDCTSVAGRPICQVATATCVGCLDATTCPTDKPSCDRDEHACRGCVSDDECASGICIEADGTCADAGATVFVSSVGTDIGDCKEATPCATIPFALQRVTPIRRVMRVVGDFLNDGASQPTFVIDRSLTIDFGGTTLPRPGNGAVFSLVSPASVVTIEGVTLTGPLTSPPITEAPAVIVGTGIALRLFNSTITGSGVEVANGTLDARNLKVAASVIRCTSGTLLIRDSTFSASKTNYTNCQTTITKNRFDLAPDAAFQGQGGVLTFENNVLIVNSEFSDLISTGGHAPGSVIAFNTIVNTATVLKSPAALSCDATFTITSNIIAYHSTAPILGQGCIVRASLFDLEGAAAAPGNPSGDASTFFKSRASGDFHLATASPALNVGEPNIVTSDFDGNPRPAPAGSRPDVGAYEAP